MVLLFLERNLILYKDGKFYNFLHATPAKNGFTQRRNDHNGFAIKVFVVIVVPLCETFGVPQCETSGPPLYKKSSFLCRVHTFPIFLFVYSIITSQ